MTSSTSKLSIIDYGAGNIGSVINMLQHIGVSAEVINDSEKVKKANKIVLPGVGNWDAGMQKLQESGLIEVLKERVLEDSVPILGICLGMQLFLNSSEEGVLPGLGWINGKVKNFNFSSLEPFSKKLAVPHMGWNSVSVIQDCNLTQSLHENSKFYFVHSYHAEVEDRKDVMLQTQYGYPFASAIRKDNIYGVQFHPEKSHLHGMNIMKSFASL